MNWRFWRSPQGADSETCSTLEPLLSLYSDGMASASETRRVKRHLADCPDCRRSLRWMQATHVVISKRPVALPPPDLQARIARAIAASAPEPVVFQTKRRPAVLRPAVWAAAASLAVMGIVAEHLPQSPQPVRPMLTTPTVAVNPPTGTMPRVSPAKPYSVAKLQPLRVKSHVRSLSHPSDESHIAAVPPKPVLPVRSVHTHESSPLIAQLPPAPSDKTVTIKNVPTHHTAPKQAPLIAIRPKPTLTLPAAVKPKHEETLVREAKKSVTPTPSENLNETAPPAEATPAPASVQVAVNTEPPTSSEHSSHSGLLDGVKLRVASLNGVSVARKIYRDSSARVMAATYTTGAESGRLPAIMPIAYSPTSLSSH